MTVVPAPRAEGLLLTIAFRHRINEPNVEAGFARFLALAQEPVTCDEFHDAVASCLHVGLIHEPIRLSEGTLQCRWHLELTPAGVTAARDP